MTTQTIKTPSLAMLARSAAVKHLVDSGVPIPEAFDMLFGEGAYLKLAYTVYAELKAKQTQTEGLQR